VAPSQENDDANRQEAIRRIVQTYMQTGQEEYNEGFFEESVTTFLTARKYKEYLPVAMRERLNELLKKSWIAVLEETFREVINLIKLDRLNEAKAYLEKIKGNKFLTKEEQKDITDALRKLETQIIAELWSRSIELYSIGQYEKARISFIQIASSNLITPDMRETVEGYLTEIDKLLGERVERKLVQEQDEPVVVAESEAVEEEPKPEVAVPEEPETEVAEAEVVEAEVAETEVLEPEVPSDVVVLETALKVVSPVTGQSNYIERINRERDIIRSYTRAVVNDAIAKAGSYTKQARFDKAKNVVETAALTVNKNQMHLGDELFKEYSSKLEVLTEEIVKKENEKIRQAEQEKRKSATEAQRRFREQMEIDRNERIAELMKNALTYQKQQRYEAALGQLVSLIALDPQNEQALVLKDTLEDMIYFRKQLEVQRDSNRQRADVLLKTDESGIPYAEELTYPKYWRELIEKPTRQPDKPIGLDPLDAAVYEQLEKIIDLSDLTPGMSFDEVIEKLEESVEPSIQIQPNWRDLLENAEVEQSTPAGMDPLTGVKLRKALEILLAGVSSIDFAELIYVVDEGVILIGTVDMLVRPMVHRVYDISDLVSEPANYGQMGRMMGMQSMMMSSMGGMGGGMMGGGMGGMGGGMMGGRGGMMGGGMSGGMGGYGGMSGGMGGYGGGMGGGMGSMGGMGMMGGGMGGMGGMGSMGGGMGGRSMMGGMGGGMGGYGGGMMGGMGGGQSGYIQSQSLVQLIQETIEPDSWFELSDTGEGTITPYPLQQPMKLAVMQTHEIHQEIEKLLAALRKSLGNQVSIEAVFLVVSENFLEDVGLDVDFSVNLGGKWGQLSFEQGSATATTPDVSTKVGGSLGGIAASATIGGGYGSILDDLQVAFLLRAVQAHTDSKSLVAPKNTVLSGESSAFSVQDIVTYALPATTQSITQPSGIGTTGTTTGFQPNVGMISVGSMLSITPTITHDKKYVLLNIVTTLTDLLRLRTHTVEGPVGADGVIEEYDITVPETETSSVMTRVSVPDGGTLLLGGQKITSEVEKEAGVPVLSKLPIIGRLFRNRSTIKDHKILLILVKPTIMLQEEREAEAIAALEGEL